MVCVSDSSSADLVKRSASEELLALQGASRAQQPRCTVATTRAPLAPHQQLHQGTAKPSSIAACACVCLVWGQHLMLVCANSPSWSPRRHASHVLLRTTKAERLHSHWPHQHVVLQERFSLPTPATTVSESEATGGKDYAKALEGLAAAAGDLNDAGFDESDGVFLDDARTEL